MKSVQHHSALKLSLFVFLYHCIVVEFTYTVFFQQKQLWNPPHLHASI